MPATFLNELQGGLAHESLIVKPPAPGQGSHVPIFVRGVIVAADQLFSKRCAGLWIGAVVQQQTRERGINQLRIFLGKMHDRDDTPE